MHGQYHQQTWDHTRRDVGGPGDAQRAARRRSTLGADSSSHELLPSQVPASARRGAPRTAESATTRRPRAQEVAEEGGGSGFVGPDAVKTRQELHNMLEQLMRDTAYQNWLAKKHPRAAPRLMARVHTPGPTPLPPPLSATPLSARWLRGCPTPTPPDRERKS